MCTCDDCHTIVPCFGQYQLSICRSRVKVLGAVGRKESTARAMHSIEVPATIRRIVATFYQLRMWSKDNDTTIYTRGLNIFHHLYFVSFIVSIALGIILTNDNDERIFLVVPLICGLVLIYKYWFILWKQQMMLALLHGIGTHSTSSQDEFIQANNKLNILMRFVQCFVLILTFGSFFALFVFPLVNEKRLFLSLAFPKRSESEFALWMAVVFETGGFFGAYVSSLLGPILWYLLYSFVLKYEMLGKQFRRMGAQALYVKDLIAAIKAYDNINEKLDEFASIFPNLFFLQIATSSLCICGSVYSLAFSSHQNLVQDGLFCLYLAFSFFEIFMVMYLPNEVAFSSGALFYCLFKSNWIDQEQSCKASILILGERLKRPQQITVGKIYPLNLETFSSIVNGAYIIFNILRNFRK